MVILLLAISFGVVIFNNYLNTQKVGEFIKNQLPDNISLEYKELNTNILLGNLTLDNAVIIAKDQGVKIEIEQLKLKGLNYRKLLTTDTVAISATEIKNAFVWVDKSKVEEIHLAEKPNQRDVIIQLKNFEVNFSGLELKDELGETRANLQGTQLRLRDLIVHSKPNQNEDHLEFGNFRLSTDSLVLPIDEFQEFHFGKTEIDNSKIRLENASLTLKDRGMQLDFESIEFNGENFQNSLSNDSVYIKEVLFSKGNVLVDNSKKQTKIVKEKVESISKIFIVSDFKLAETDFEFKDDKGKTQLKLNQSNAHFTDLLIPTSSGKNEHQLQYKFNDLDAKNVRMAMGDLHTFDIENLEVNNLHAELYNVSINPKYNRIEFQKHIKEEQDVLNLNLPKMTVFDYNFSFDDAHKFISASKIQMNSADLRVYRNKLMPDQKARKPLYSEMLRNLDLELAIGNIEIIDSKLTYEELVAANQPPGKIFFTQLNANVQNFYNKRVENDLVKIDLNANFMGHAPAQINWNFHVHRPADNFRIYGNIKNLDAKALDSFLIPNMRAQFEGEIQQTIFDFSGNDIESHGTMDMIYEDLNVSLLNQKNERKGFWSTIANFLVKSNKDEVKKTQNVDNIERVQTKSFFNYFWLNLKEGIKNNVMKFQGNNS